MEARDRLIVALDVPTAAEARALAARLRGTAGMFKVGSQLFTAAGPELVRALVAEGCRVFLDLKYHDIPNTVAAAVAEAARLGVSLVDVHALGGPAMIRAAANALGGDADRPRLLAVTVLTSHDDAELVRLGVAGSVEQAVGRLALLAREAGAAGVVAAPGEVALVREACGAGVLIVTPGIRPAGAAVGDQARPASPASAVGSGADLLVVGRPILTAPDPVAAAQAIVDEIAAATR